MSADCGNPNCPRHGNTPEAQANRETRARILCNADLMDVIRILAANAETNMVGELGVDTDDPFFKLGQYTMLSGNGDDHPTIQGLINGFVALLNRHRPTQEFFAATSQVEEEDSILKKIRKESGEDETISSLSLLDMLKALSHARR